MTPKFDAIKIAEVEYNMGALFAKAAFVSTSTGKTHGWTTCENWPTHVHEKVEELLGVIEAHLASIHFEGAEVGTAKQMTGLGELLSIEDSGANKL